MRSVWDNLSEGSSRADWLKSAVYSSSSSSSESRASSEAAWCRRCVAGESTTRNAMADRTLTRLRRMPKLVYMARMLISPVSSER